MQIKIFTVPILDGEAENERLNIFLRGHKILQVKQELVQQTQWAYWCFAVRYVEDYKLKGTKRGDIDYKVELSPEEFSRFDAFRKIRKEISVKDKMPAFAIFTDKELAELARLEELSTAAMLKIKGISDRKIEKYASYFIKKTETDETPK